MAMQYHTYLSTELLFDEDLYYPPHPQKKKVRVRFVLPNCRGLVTFVQNNQQIYLRKFFQSKEEAKDYLSHLVLLVF